MTVQHLKPTGSESLAGKPRLKYVLRLPWQFQDWSQGWEPLPYVWLLPIVVILNSRTNNGFSPFFLPGTLWNTEDTLMGLSFPFHLLSSGCNLIPLGTVLVSELGWNSSKFHSQGTRTPSDIYKNVSMTHNIPKLETSPKSTHIKWINGNIFIEWNATQ